MPTTFPFVVIMYTGLRISLLGSVETKKQHLDLGNVGNKVYRKNK